ncbi:FAD-dependent oxidoreductase [Salinisphaera sp. SWV1]|uniref:FAD-dependent oxidoreductase n=1 Tax=Salinisphaera sp. SWV1 TaxID=3454139 RepID=UPI003F86E5D2
MNKSRIALLVLVCAAVAAFFVFDLGQYLDLAYFKAQQDRLQSVVAARPMLAGAVFFLIYVAVTALSLPGAAVMTLIAGALFGMLWGTLLVSFASSIGATLAFLTARFILRDWVQKKYGQRLEAINRGIARDGAFYLFTLRLVPVFPFFVINLVMGLTPIRLATFYIVSQLGMLAGTLVFVYAGTRIAAINTLSDVLSPGLLVAFVLLGVFPLVARRIIDRVQARKALSGHPKPRRFDCNLVVIGAGSAGLVTAYIAAAVRAKVTLIEKHRMGGDCLNYGCVPSKAMIRSARVAALMRRGAEFGVHADNVRVDFAEVMARIQRVIAEIAPHDSVERYRGLGVDTIEGEAHITSPYTVAVNGRELTTRSIVIATGARPLVPPIPGLDTIDYLTSDTVWDLRELPERLLVLGGGNIGCELSQAFARFGSQVTQVEMTPRLLAREDPEVSAHLLERLTAEGIDVRTGHTAKAVERRDGNPVLVCEHQGREVAFAFDRILVAVGRTPNIQGFGLEELGIETSPTRTLAVNEFLQTRYPNILACGDVAGPYQFTHAAAHQAWYASVNALFLGIRRFKADYSVIPWVTFTDPEIAHVGRNETQAEEDGIAFEVTRYDLGELDRAITEGQARGFVKVLTVPGKDKILGATIVGENAGELIGEFVTAMRHGLGLNKILGTIHAYPTLIEANKYAAGEWKRAHAPARILAWLERFHGWRRDGRGGVDSERAADAER